MFAKNLISVLRETIDYLSAGNEMAFDGSIPSEIAEELRSFLLKVESKEKINKDHLRLYFAPTGVIQECSMANGWSDEFLELASKFDAAISFYWK